MPCLQLAQQGTRERDCVHFVRFRVICEVLASLLFARLSGDRQRLGGGGGGREGGEEGEGGRERGRGGEGRGEGEVRESPCFYCIFIHKKYIHKKYIQHVQRTLRHCIYMHVCQYICIEDHCSTCEEKLASILKHGTLVIVFSVVRKFWDRQSNENGVSSLALMLQRETNDKYMYIKEAIK